VIPDIGDLKSTLDKALGIEAALKTQESKLDADISFLEKEEEILNLVVELFRQMADAEITEATQAVESLLSEGLYTVFEDQDITVETEVRLVRGKVSVDLHTIRKYPDGREIKNSSLEGFGGSITTIQSILLRIIVMLKQGLRPLLILDESLMALENRYIETTGKLLRSLCERLDLDALVITHNPELVEYAHTHWDLKKGKNSSTFKRVK